MSVRRAGTGAAYGGTNELFQIGVPEGPMAPSRTQYETVKSALDGETEYEVPLAVPGMRRKWITIPPTEDLKERHVFQGGHKVRWTTDLDLGNGFGPVLTQVKKSYIEGDFWFTGDSYPVSRTTHKINASFYTVLERGFESIVRVLRLKFGAQTFFDVENYAKYVGAQKGRKYVNNNLYSSKVQSEGHGASEDTGDEYFTQETETTSFNSQDYVVIVQSARRTNQSRWLFSDSDYDFEGDQSALVTQAEPKRLSKHRMQLALNWPDVVRKIDQKNTMKSRLKFTIEIVLHDKINCVLTNVTDKSNLKYNVDNFVLKLPNIFVNNLAPIAMSEQTEMLIPFTTVRSSTATIPAETDRIKLQFYNAQCSNARAILFTSELDVQESDAFYTTMDKNLAFKNPWYRATNYKTYAADGTHAGTATTFDYFTDPMKNMVCDALWYIILDGSDVWPGSISEECTFGVWARETDRLFDQETGIMAANRSTKYDEGVWGAVFPALDGIEFTGISIDNPMTVQYQGPRIPTGELGAGVIQRNEAAMLIRCYVYGNATLLITSDGAVTELTQ